VLQGAGTVERVTLKVRLLLYTLFGAMGSLWLSLAAVFAALASGKPRALVELAYWPSRLSGIASQDYMYPKLVEPILVNILGWTTLASLVGLLHHSLVAAKKSSSERGTI
jgi:hypothetical protein